MASLSLDARKVRSIYDAIDGGAYKLAVQTCNKLLKKNPRADIVKTLKALALLRSNKIDEAIVLCDQVLATRPSDEEVLNALTHVLRHLERHDDIISLYDDAFKKQPHNEELGAQAFMAMVRIGSWKTAQQISLRMSKTFKEDTRLSSWSVMSALLQALDDTTPPQTKPILLTLARRLVEGLPPQIGSLSTPDKLHLHLQILLAFEEPKLEDAYTLLSERPAKLMWNYSLVIDEVRREVWHKLGKWEEEREICQSRLENGDRNWLNFLSYIDSTFGLLTTPPSSEETTVVVLSSSTDQPEDPLSSTAAFLRIIATKDGSKERGGHLAHLEFHHRLRAHSRANPNVNIAGQSEDARRVALMKVYFGLFGDKACCFEDLKPYVDDILDFPALGQDGVDDITVWTDFLAQADRDTSTTRNLIRTLNIHKLTRYIQPTTPPPSTQSEIEYARELFGTYLSALPLGKDLATTELQPADDLALLAANVLVGAWAEGGRLKYSLVYRALTILEYASAQSIHNYQFKLLLVRLYTLLGAHTLALHHYKQLTVKTLQHETMSHFVLVRGSTFSLVNNGDLAMISEALDASQIYQDNTVDTPEMLTKAFQHEKYSQIPTFIEFEDRLDRSLQRDLVKMEHVRMRFIVEPPATEETLALEISELDFLLFNDKVHHDNRDYNVIPNYQPRGQSVETQTAMGPRPQIKWHNIFVKLYIRALNKAAQPAFHSPNLAAVSGDDLVEFTDAERAFIEHSHVVATWLWPADTPRPKQGEAPYPKYNPEEYQSEFAKLTSATSIAAIVAGSASNGANGKGKKEETKDSTTENPSDAPAALDVPAVSSSDVLAFFKESVQRVKSAIETNTLAWEVIHIAALMQEAYVLFNIQSAPFGPSPNGKPKKADPIHASVKTLRTQIVKLLHEVSQLLEAYAERTNDTRKSFITDCESLAGPSDDEKIQDFVITLSRKISDSQKALIGGMAKGIAKVADGKRPVIAPLI